MTKRPVLVVEDDDTLRTLILDVLIAEGYDVLAARNGVAGLDLVRQTQPAVILLDAHMPVMDGGAFLSAYRQTPGPHAPVVVISGARGAEATSLGASGAPVDGILEKPFDLEELLALVEHHATVASTAN